jgi:hypothetical protein
VRVYLLCKHFHLRVITITTIRVVIMSDGFAPGMAKEVDGLIHSCYLS